MQRLSWSLISTRQENSSSIVCPFLLKFPICTFLHSVQITPCSHLRPGASQQGVISWLQGLQGFCRSLYSSSWLCKILKTALQPSSCIHSDDVHHRLKRKHHSFAFQQIWPHLLLSKFQVISPRIMDADSLFPQELMVWKQQWQESRAVPLEPLHWPVQLQRRPKYKPNIPASVYAFMKRQ